MALFSKVRQGTRAHTERCRSIWPPLLSPLFSFLAAACCPSGRKWYHSLLSAPVGSAKQSFEFLDFRILLLSYQGVTGLTARGSEPGPMGGLTGGLPLSGPDFRKRERPGLFLRRVSSPFGSASKRLFWFCNSL